MEQCTEEAVQQMLPLVSNQRREQALRYKHILGRFCCLKSWLMLKELFIRNYELEITNYEWTYNEHGKPFIHHTPYTIHFSLSHCKEGIAVAIDEQPIGIDIEGIRRADEELIKRVMNEEERELVNEGVSELEKARCFTRLWTQKEAVVKMIGTGIESFEQLQQILPKYRDIEISTFEKEKYIYSIAKS